MVARRGRLTSSKKENVMNPRSRHPSTILLLSLSLLAASSAPDLPRPTFLFKIGEYGIAENQLGRPDGIDFDSSGNMYVAESLNARIQKFDSEGNFLLMWGWGVDDGAMEFQKCTSTCQAGDEGYHAGQFDEPVGLAVDPSGNVFVSDFQNARVQKFDSDGNFLFTFGWGVDDGAAEFQICTSNCRKGTRGDGAGQFYAPSGLEIDSAGNVYVADGHNDRVKKFANNGNFLLTFGWGVQNGVAEFQTCTSSCREGIQGSGDGQFSGPYGVAVDDSGNIYVGDFGNDRVQKFSSSPSFVTKWGSTGAGDDEFWGPTGVAVGPSGNVHVADFYNKRVKEHDPDGNFLQMWGWGVLDGSPRFQVCRENCQKGQSGFGDGQFWSSMNLEFNADGGLYVTDHGGHKVQVFVFSEMEFFIGDAKSPNQPGLPPVQTKTAKTH
jgi:DNA-binding beta-propeller fold protein YncE